MRTLTARERALYDIRYSALRTWANGVEGAPDTHRLRLLALHDDTASAVCRYQSDIYKAFLVEPTGEVPHHALASATWEFFRTAMRTTPSILYRDLGSEIVGVYDETVSAPPYRNGWRRPSIAADGSLSLTRTLDSEVPEQYFNVADSSVAEFLSCSGGTIRDADKVPDPYPVLSLPDFEVTLGGSAITVDLGDRSIGGKPPLVYTLLHVADITATIASGSDTLVLGRGSAVAGTYTGRVKVTDSTGASVEATFTVTVP